MELSAGIHKIDGVSGANSFLVIAEAGAAVVDTGLPGNERKIVEYAKGAGVPPDRLSYIVLTHPDIDHSGSVAKLKGLTGAKVAIHRADAARLSGKQKLKEVKGATGVLLGVMSPFMRFTPVEPDLSLEEGDRVLDLAVVHTPGHTEGSITLYREGKAAFVGDALRTDSSGKPGLTPSSFNADTERAKESVKKIASLQFEMLLPGHGAPLTKGGSAALAGFVQNGFR